MKKKYKFIIGIDPGVDTGICFYSALVKQIISVRSCPIHEAMAAIKTFKNQGASVFVRVEDARQRRWFADKGRAQLQGAGSIKRDAKIWEDYLTYLKVDFEMVAPKNNKTKLTAEVFNRMTGWTGKSNEHGRDAAGLVMFL